MIILCRKREPMADITIKTVQPQKRKLSTPLMATAGALVGTGMRYVLPTKDELSNIFNKNTTDTFVSTLKNTAKADKRSILLYGGIGALIAAGTALIINAFRGNKNKEEDFETVEYSKYGAAIDSSDYACMVLWYGDKS